MLEDELDGGGAQLEQIRPQADQKGLLYSVCSDA